ncbi:MAG TPA: CsgG/HfaB family protein [Verrucomicrobiae bacterium]|nr:CsgG/HfaB family protein [Verrucomicrobiae bacterium]
MKQTFASTLFLLIATTVIFAQTQKPITVGILKLECHFIMLGKDATSLLTADLSADPRFNFVDRGQLQKVLDEEALGASGIVTPDSAAKIGQLTGAKVLVGGRVLKDSKNNITILADIIGTENGRMFSETENGSRTNLEAMTSELAKKIAQTIADQSTNFLASATTEREEHVSQIIAKIKGKQRPAVLIKIDEQLPGGAGTFQTTETELGVLLQKAGFTVVDEKSDAKPDVIISGEAIAATTAKNGSFFLSHATLEIKAQERTTGKIISFDRQENVAADIGEQMAARKALENATDEMAERLLPLLAQ